MSNSSFIIFVVVLFLVLSGFWLWSNRCEKRAFHQGYEQGAHQTMLYHEATGEYPSKAWRLEHERQNIQDIEENNAKATQ